MCRQVSVLRKTLLYLNVIIALVVAFSPYQFQVSTRPVPHQCSGVNVNSTMFSGSSQLTAGTGVQRPLVVAQHHCSLGS